MEANKALVKLNEKFDISNASEFDDIIDKINNQGIERVKLDFSRLKTIDSSGVGKIMLLKGNLDKRDGKLKIINMKSEYIKEMFNAMKLENILEIE